MFDEYASIDLYQDLVRKGAYLAFDVNGTITKSRQEISAGLKEFFFSHIPMDRVALITGSDVEKTQEQVGMDFWEQCGYSLQCCGNEVYRFGKLESSSEWQADSSVMNALVEVLASSRYPWSNRKGKHIESRTGMINFSVVGRNAVGEEREHYADYDRAIHERRVVAKHLKSQFAGLEFVCGGDTGIDIFPVGKDKSQAIDIIGTELIFLGDRMDPEGNDYSLATALSRVIAPSCAKSFHVSGPEEVRAILSCYLRKDLRIF